MVKYAVNDQISCGMHESVCVYVWDMLLKGQNVLTIPFLFSSLFGARIKIGVKIDIFL